MHTGGQIQWSYLDLLLEPSGPTCVTVLEAIDAKSAALQDVKA